MLTPRSSNGWIALITMSIALSLTFYWLKPGGDQSASGVGAVLKSGPLVCTITGVQQTPEGVVVEARITNRSEQIVQSANTSLAVKDAVGMRLASDENAIGDGLMNGLAPRGMVTERYFFYDLSEVNIGSFSFRASYVTYAES